MGQCSCEGCETEGKLTRGMCKRHYDRWLRTGGDPTFPEPMDPLSTLLKRTDLQGDCLVWNGPSTDPNGRGQMRFNGRSTWAHRVVWECTNGPIPKGLVVRHTCDVAACLNIDHMLLGTQGDNMRDKQERGRGLWAVCRNGLHELSGDNVYVMPSKPSYRECRACKNERNRRYHAKRGS